MKHGKHGPSSLFLSILVLAWNFLISPHSTILEDTSCILFCSLMQWLGHNKTCPQCREKCMRKNVIRLFVDSSDSLSQANVELDPEEMKVNGLGVCVCVFEIIYQHHLCIG